jgi:hypothetical protein
MLKRKRKAKAKARVKARVSHTRRKVKRVIKRRAPMAKKKSSDESYVEDEPQEEMDAGSAIDPKEPEQPELTTTEATEEGVYKTGQACVIKGQSYPEGAEVALTPEELESVQAVGVKIHPAD